jgi:hypothetical protein
MWGYDREYHFVLKFAWGDFSLFCLDSMRSTISAKSSQLCGDRVSLSDRPWMSSYVMQCVSWLWTVFWPSSDYFPGELKWKWAIDIASCGYGQLEIAILHGDLEQIAKWVEAPRRSSKRPWNKGWNPLMRIVKTDITIHWKALEEHFLLVPLVFGFSSFH